MEKGTQTKKPIDNIKEDLESVINKVEDLQMNIYELRNDFKDLSNKLEKHFKDVEQIDKELKDKLMVNGRSSYFPFW